MPSVEMHASGSPYAASLMLQQSLQVDCTQSMMLNKTDWSCRKLQWL